MRNKLMIRIKLNKNLKVITITNISIINLLIINLLFIIYLFKKYLILKLYNKN